MNSQDTTSAIFLPGLDFGLWPCDGLDSKAGPASGQEVVLASHSVVPAQEKERQTNATCGQSSATSSGPADPELSSESRLPAPQLSDMLGLALQRRLARYGSMEYEQTWKLRVTPSGLRYWAHTASAHRTSGSGCTGSPTVGHPTPSSEGSAGEISEDLEREGNKIRNRKTGRILQTNLATDTLMLCGHPTPNALPENRGGLQTCPENALKRRESGHMLNLDDSAQLAGHPSPRAEDSEQTGTHRGNPDTLPSCSRLTGHPTCSARDWKGTPGMATTGTNPDGSERSRLDMLPRVSALALGATTASTDTSTGKTGGYRLNSGFSLWLMIGIPGIVDEWASCGVRAMQSCRRSRRSS